MSKILAALKSFGVAFLDGAARLQPEYWVIEAEKQDVRIP